MALVTETDLGRIEIRPQGTSESMGELTVLDRANEVGFAWRSAGSKAQPFFPEEEPAPSEEPTEDSASPHATPHSSGLFVIIFNQI